MGCGSTLLSTYTVKQVEAEAARFTQLLPVAELTKEGYIKIEGANGFFNPDSLRDPAWLKDRMNVNEFYKAIDYINKCTAHTHVGLSKVHSPMEKEYRANLRFQAGMIAVQQLNQKYPYVRFTYHKTNEIMKFNVMPKANPEAKYKENSTDTKGNAIVTILYVNVK